MGTVVVVLLLAAWAIVLLPSLVPRRFFSSPVDGVRNFENLMGILANARNAPHVPGRWIMVPPDPDSGPRRRRNRVVARRRRAFQRLVIAAAVTLVLGIVPPLRGFWLAHLAINAALAGYVVQLRRWRMRETQRRRVVRRLSPEPAAFSTEAVAVFDEVASQIG